MTRQPNTTLLALQHEIQQSEEKNSGLDRPTLAIALAIALTLAAIQTAYAIEAISVWTAGLLNIVPFYCCQIVVHEATHGNIARNARRYRWLDPILGHIYAGFLFWDFRTFRHLHFRHHQATNHPQLDVDWMPQGAGFGYRLVKAMFFLPHALCVAGRQLLFDRSAPRNRREVITSWVLFYGAASLAFAMAPVVVFVIWILPAAIATAGLALMHWSLHTEAEHSATIFKTTREISSNEVWSPLVTATYLYQNHHLVHHLFPHVPFHRMSGIARRIEPLFQEEGVEIVALEALCRPGRQHQGAPSGEPAGWQQSAAGR